MPKFTIVETLIEERVVEADSAQAALEIWLNHGSDSSLVSDEVSVEVQKRHVEDAGGNHCPTEDL